MKKALAAVVCLVMVLALLPATASAAGESVTINGMTLSSATPYYVNGDGSTVSTEPPVWNAWLDVENSTLHLKSLVFSTDQTAGIQTSDIDTLCLDLEGDNTVTTTNSDSTAAAIKCSNLVVCGTGKLEAIASTGNNGIDATSIKLQYPARLTVSSTDSATSVNVTCSEGTAAYTATAGEGGAEITDYFSNTGAFSGKANVAFTPKLDAPFPIWVNGTRVTANNMDNVLGNSTASYTPAAGITPAKLTLNGATIDSINTVGTYRAGVYTTEPLDIHLIGSNYISIGASATSPTPVYGVHVNGGPLTITADAGASLYSNVTAPSGATVNCHGIHAEDITIDGGDITAEGRADRGVGSGVSTNNCLTVNGGKVTASSSGWGLKKAVETDSLVLGTGMVILTPDGGVFDSASGYIEDSNGAAAENVVIDRVYTVTYDANGGTGSMANDTATSGTAFTLPACGFTAPAGQRFKGWAIGSTGGTRIAANETYSFTADTTVYAIWGSASSGGGYYTTYQITKGQSAIWAGGSGLSFTVNGSYNKLMGVRVDGSPVSSDNSAAQNGGTVVSLKQTYLETLPVGRHTLRVAYTDGYAETYFTVSEYIAIPKTGDSSPLALCLGALLTAGALLILRRKRANG